MQKVIPIAPQLKELPTNNFANKTVAGSICTKYIIYYNLK